MRYLISLVFIALLTGCSDLGEKEFARFSFDNSSFSEDIIIEETSGELKQGDMVTFWTEMDIEYKQEIQLAYIVQVWKDSLLVGKKQLNALDADPILEEEVTTLDTITSWKFTGKLDQLTIEESGIYVFRATIGTPESSLIDLKKAILILKK